MINCVSFAQEWKLSMKQYYDQTKKDKFLAIVQVGDHAPSNAYVKGKISDFNELGIPCKCFRLDENIDYELAKKVIDDLNNNPECGGIIVQLPLSERLSGLYRHVDRTKDVDGLVFDSGFIPCTAKAVIKLIDWLNYDLTGKRVVIVGRSKLVGKPLIDLMLRRNATVISCNSYTENLEELTRLADVIVSATGIRGLIKPGMIGGDTIVIDVGITKGEDGKLYGDCDRRLYTYVDKITPVPKGVGLLTRCALIDNFLGVLQTC